MRCRFLTVPVNRQGIDDYNYGMESENILTFQLLEDEFEILFRTVFPVINRRCGLLIDDYESEEISAQNIERCWDIIDAVDGVFKDACSKAVLHRTFVALDF